MSYRSTLKKVWALLSPRARRQAYGLLGLTIFVGLLEAAGIGSVVPFLALLAGKQDSQAYQMIASIAANVGIAPQNALYLAAGIFMVMVIIGQLSLALLQFRLNTFIHYQASEIAERVLGRLMGWPYERLVRHNSSELSNLVLNEVGNFVVSVLRPSIDIQARAIIVLFILVPVAFVASLSSLGFVGAIVVCFLAVYQLLRTRLQHYGKERILASEARFKVANEVFSAIKEIRIFNSERLFLRQFRGAYDRYAKATVFSVLAGELPTYLVNIVLFTVLGVSGSVMYSLAADKTTVFTSIGVLGLAGYRLLPSVKIVYSELAKLRFGGPILARLIELLDSGSAPAMTRTEDTTPFSGIALRGLEYQYPGTEAPTLQGIHLTLAPGTILGVVGKTGAGKTTLINLLSGLLEPTKGQLLLNGSPARELPPGHHFSWVGYVSQQPILIDASIAENVALGLDLPEVDLERVARACRQAGVAEFIERKLPQGYLSRVGERGAFLSGGQVQRIALARALYRDPKILILDEFTSSLDAATESAIVEGMRTLRDGRVIIMVTHRPAPLALCDRILRLDEGKVVMEGFHESQVLQ
jgi:ATP-binding cassette, subfamily B, bacterial PglK